MNPCSTAHWHCRPAALRVFVLGASWRSARLCTSAVSAASLRAPPLGPRVRVDVYRLQLSSQLSNLREPYGPGRPPVRSWGFIIILYEWIVGIPITVSYYDYRGGISVAWSSPRGTPRWFRWDACTDRRRLHRSHPRARGACPAHHIAVIEARGSRARSKRELWSVMR